MFGTEAFVWRCPKCQALFRERTEVDLTISIRIHITEHERYAVVKWEEEERREALLAMVRREAGAQPLRRYDPENLFEAGDDIRLHGMFIAAD